MKTGLSALRKEHINSFIDTLEKPDLASQLLLLRVDEAKKMEITLREYQRGGSSRGNVTVGLSKFRQKMSSVPAPFYPRKQ